MTSGSSTSGGSSSTGTDTSSSDDDSTKHELPSIRAKKRKMIE